MIDEKQAIFVSSLNLAGNRFLARSTRFPHNGTVGSGCVRTFPLPKISGENFPITSFVSNLFSPNYFQRSQKWVRFSITPHPSDLICIKQCLELVSSTTELIQLQPYMWNNNLQDVIKLNIFKVHKPVRAEQEKSLWCNPMLYQVIELLFQYIEVLSRDFQIQANQGQTTMGYPCSLGLWDFGRRTTESNNFTAIERRWFNFSTFSFNQHTLHSK